MTTSPSAQEKAQQTAATAADESKQVAGTAKQEAQNVAAEARAQVNSLLDDATREVSEQSRTQRDRAGRHPALRQRRPRADGEPVELDPASRRTWSARSRSAPAPR